MKDTCRAVYGGASMINRDCRLTCLVPISMEAIHRSWVNFIFTPFYMFHYFNSSRFSGFTLHVPIGHAPYRGRDGNSRAFSRMARMLSLIYSIIHYLEIAITTRKDRTLFPFCRIELIQ